VGNVVGGQKISKDRISNLPDLDHLDERHPPHPRIPDIDDGFSNNIDRVYLIGFPFEETTPYRMKVWT